MNTTRTRWAAIGAAVAVTLGAGGIGITHATTSSGAMPIFLPLDEPCRLADTRPAPDTVGPRTTGIGPAETYDLDGWGTVGDCTLPTDTSALVTNVTAVGATQQTNLRFFPQGATLPTTANLNPSPGASATPNAVTVGLNDTNGQFSVYNAFGTVAVIIDVIGYYDDHVHTGADIVDGSLTAADSRDEPGVAFDFVDTAVSILGAPTVVVATSIAAPSDGYVLMQATGHWSNGDEAAHDIALCQLQLGATGEIVTSGEPWFRLDDRNVDEAYTSFSAHRIVEIDVDEAAFALVSGQSVSLVCDEINGDVRLADVTISATFFPTSYETSPPVLTTDGG